MSITRTQIAKQLLANGGRTGFQGGGRDASTRSFAESQGRSRAEVNQLGRDFGFSGRDVAGDSGRQRPDSASAIVPPKKPKIKKETFSSRIRKFIPPTASFFNFLGNRLGGTKLARMNNALQRQNFLRTLSPEEQVEALEDLAKIGIGTDNPMGITRNIDRGMEDKGFLGTGIGGGKFITDLDFGDPEAKAVLDQFGYDNYLNRNKKDFEPDGTSDPCLGPNPPAYCFVGIRSAAPAVEEPEYVNPLSKLTARIAGSQFAADGGRIGLQEGGGIEQRLEQLGGDVTSAEQMLQGINQRLKTAESSLSSGGRGPGGLGTLATLAGSNQPFMGNMLPSNADPQTEKLTPLGNNFPGLGIFPPTADPLQIGNYDLTKGAQIPEQFREGYAEFMKGKPMPMGGQALSSVGLPGGGSVTFGDTGSAASFREYLESTGFTPPSPLAVATLSPLGGGLENAFMGNMNYMNNQPGQLTSTFIPAPEPQRFSSYEEMMSQRMTKDVPAFFTDLEGVQRRPDGSLFEPKFGELPTPLSGIPAAGYADGGRITSLEDMDREGFILGGVAKGLKKAVRGIKKLAKSPIGKAALAYAAFTYGPGLLKGKTLPPSMGFKSKGLFDIVRANPMKSIFAASLAAGAMTPKEDKFDTDSYYASGKLNPSLSTRMMGSDFDFYGGQRIASAEGGSTDKEPVAKKTMPLLDMGGKEMDLREEGGFVPIGRMEKADDVPARLSKNEFVFTADAVRNAGDGDVDKGAEVMYNMMKNLEAGGEVSEESQGLEGARKMFQTSQRLEEVL